MPNVLAADRWRFPELFRCKGETGSIPPATKAGLQTAGVGLLAKSCVAALRFVGIMSCLVALLATMSACCRQSCRRDSLGYGPIENAY